MRVWISLSLLCAASARFLENFDQQDTPIKASSSLYARAVPVQKEAKAYWWRAMVASWNKVSTFPKKSPIEYPSEAGAGVYVYIFDTGVNKDNDFLNKRVDDFYKSYAGTDFKDVHGHGTAVASMAVGLLSGVAPAARAVNVKVLDDDGLFGENIIQAIVDVTERHNAWKAGKADKGKVAAPNGFTGSIINLSLDEVNEPGVPDFIAGGPFGKAIEDAVSAGIPIFGAAGNEATSDVGPIAQIEYIFPVASVDASYTASKFSNYGPKVRGWAPGDELTVAKNTGGTQVLSGTSLSCPIACSIAAGFVSEEKLNKNWDDVQMVYSRMVENSREFVQPYQGRKLGNNYLMTNGYGNPNRPEDDPYEKKSGQKARDVGKRTVPLNNTIESLETSAHSSEVSPRMEVAQESLTAVQTTFATHLTTMVTAAPVKPREASTTASFNTSPTCSGSFCPSTPKTSLQVTWTAATPLNTAVSSSVSSSKATATSHAKSTSVSSSVSSSKATATSHAKSTSVSSSVSSSKATATTAATPTCHVNTEPFPLSNATDAIGKFCKNRNLKDVAQDFYYSEKVTVGIDVMWADSQTGCNVPDAAKWETIPEDACKKYLGLCVNDCQKDTTTNKLGGKITWNSPSGCIFMEIFGTM